MNLEAIVNKALLPFRAIDKTVKLAYDSLEALTLKKGIDRFTLAEGASYLVTGGLVAIGINTAINQQYVLATVATLGAVLEGFLIPKKISELRDYHYKAKDVLDSELEVISRRLRKIRFFTLTYGVALLSFSPDTTGLASGFTCLMVASTCYLEDGDHSLFDKTKELAKNAYHKVISALPKGIKQPAPEPGYTGA